MKVKVAVLQYSVPDDPEAAYTKLDELLGQVAWMGVKLVVAPETAIGNGGEVKAKETDYRPQLSRLAKDHKIYLCTSLYSKESGKIFNQGYIVGPDGEPVIAHKKMYPAKPEADNLGVVAGKNLEAVDTEIGKLGMLVCKDGFNKYSHFLYQKLGEMGTQIICIPAWSLSWKQLYTQEYVKAHFVYGAFTSRTYVLMSGNLNTETGSFGRSLIVSPVRGILKEASTDKKEILIEELDLDDVTKAREFDSWWQPQEKVNIK